MSNAKPKPAEPATKKIFDVAKPGKSAPSSSAKPIIITNRPVLKDPMVTAETPDTATADGAPLASKTRTKITIAPIDEDLRVPAKDPETSQPEMAETPAHEPKSAEPATEAAPKPTEAVAPPAKEPTEAGATTSTPEAVSEPKSAPAEPATMPKDDAEATPGDAQKASEKEDEEAIRKEVERQTELQKIIESKKYFLPINTVEKRRNKRDVLLGFFFILLLAVVWADIALDAGMIHIHGVHAYSHFFTK